MIELKTDVSPSSSQPPPKTKPQAQLPEQFEVKDAPKPQAETKQQEQLKDDGGWGKSPVDRLVDYFKGE